MGKKKSGRVGGIRLDVKPNVEVKPGPNNGLQRSASGLSISKTVGSCETVSIDMEVESQLEKLMSKANDEATLKTFAQAWDKIISEKLELRATNQNVSYEEFEKLISSKKLDSNLKKCTGFVRKMRQYTESQKASIENDIKTLNLTKYLSEIAAAVTEARYKIGELSDIITICSWIHQRYSEFSTLLLESYKKAFPTKKTEFSAAVLSKLSVDLRMVGDLVVCGVLPGMEGTYLVVGVIRSMLAMDKEGMQCLIPILSFCRGLGDEFLGVIPRSISTLCHQYAVNLIRSDIFGASKKSQFHSTIKEYYLSALSGMMKMHGEVQSSELHNRRLLRTRGEIPADRKEAHLGIVNKFEKFHCNVAKFADALDEELPELPRLPVDPDEEEERAMLIDESGERLESVPGIVVFEDEETRSFYQDFKDLKVYLPPVAYRENVQQAAEQTQAIEEREKALDIFDDEIEAAELKNEKDTLEDDVPQEGDSDVPPSMRIEREEKEMDVQIKPTFQAFLNQLPNCVNRNMIDKAAMEFAESHNNKPNRKKLVNTLFRVPRQRMDLIPFYSRLVAILAPVMPDIGLELCQLLKNDFRYLVRKKHQIFIETKVKITRFIAELVNFRIFPKSDALQCLKVLLMDFVHHQVEMACVFVETCGRYLYRTPDSHRRIKIYLEEMIRKKLVKSMEPRYVSMIDHAYFFVVPPEGGLRHFKKKPPLEAYLELILFDDLNKTTLNFTIEQMTSLDWDDEKVAAVGIRYLSQPWRVTYQQLSLYAKVLVGLKKYEPAVVQMVVDLLMEDIRRGLEKFSVTYNHRRLSTIRFLSELYDYRLIGTPTLFDILYLLVTYGTTLDVSRPSPIDPPDNLFRIRLACYILKESGECLYGSSKKKLRCYLKYLQRYYWFKKDLPIWGKGRFPFSTQELFEDVIQQAFPSAKRVENFEDAQKEVEEMEESLKQRMGEEFKEKIDSENARLEVIPESHDEEMASFNGCFQGMSMNDPMSVGPPFSLIVGPSGDTGESGPCGYNPRLQEKLSCNNGTFNPHQFAQSSNSGYPGLNEQCQPLDPYNDVDTVASMKSQQHTSREDQEFIYMLDQMCSEVNHGATRDGGKHMKTDIPIPLHIRSSAHSTSKIPTPDSGGPSGSAEGANTVPFVLITRKGNKQQFKTLDVPADSDFVQKIKSREEAERAEKENVKRRTLAISQRQEEEERDREQAAIKSAQKHAFGGEPSPTRKMSLSSFNQTRFDSWVANNMFGKRRKKLSHVL